MSVDNLNSKHELVTSLLPVNAFDYLVISEEFVFGFTVRRDATGRYHKYKNLSQEIIMQPGRQKGKQN